MKRLRFICTHCGHKFEAEEKDGLECPLCFWSSSVKKEEDLQDETSPPEARDFSAVSGAGGSSAAAKWVSLFFLLITAAVFGTLIFFSIRYQDVLKSKNPFRNVAIGKFLPKAGETPPLKSVQGAASPLLTEEEKAVLTRSLEISADRPLAEEEKKVLENFAGFNTGIVERLPSQPWTLENFQELIKSQETAYKVPLPRSYKKKLEAGFQQHYLPGKDAFEAGDLLSARNHWTDALVFPIYANDVQKHRGVALTMLRSFINDTLAKIGAVNATLIEKRVREKEAETTRAYQTFNRQLSQKNWTQTLESLSRVERLLEEFENPASLAGAVPGYPPSIAEVDADVRGTLTELLDVPPPPVAAFEAVRQDLAGKRKVIESFLPERLEEVRKKYQAGLEAAGRQSWQEAEEHWRGIDAPPDLVRDVQAKRAILKKLMAKLDSPSKSR